MGALQHHVRAGLTPSLYMRAIEIGHGRYRRQDFRAAIVCSATERRVIATHPRQPKPDRAIPPCVFHMKFADSIFQESSGMSIHWGARCWQQGLSEQPE
jgi:hypothetical protein